jgi:DNA-binding XRE family transcriptional regulator
LRADRWVVSEKFGRNLREARKWAGLTQKQLVPLVSLDQRTISQLECGWNCPRLDVIVTLARALDVRVCDLVDGIE